MTIDCYQDAAVAFDFHIEYRAEDDACSVCGAVSWGMTMTGHAECARCGRVEAA